MMPEAALTMVVVMGARESRPASPGSLPVSAAIRPDILESFHFSLPPFLDILGAIVLLTIAGEPFIMPEPVIRNPILPGFNPDPSIVRVGDDYYVATSTFEWYSGVQIHHSRDLSTGVCSGAAHPREPVEPAWRRRFVRVWAPCLTYADGLVLD